MNDSPFPRWRWPRAAYVHVPFCQHHCGYCDFAVTAGQDHLIDLYLEALSLELAGLEQICPVETIFIGGGTPTYLSGRQLERLLSDIQRWLPLQTGGEFSIEATPESISLAKVDCLAQGGVNRVSLGVQTFHGHLLPTLDRIHQPWHVVPAIEMIQKKIPNISLDLIFGIPQQSLADWQADLQTAIDLQTCHLSTYGLTYEKGTPLWKQWQRGEVQSQSEEHELAMYEWVIDHLTASGFEHYEISNFARPGKACRHNQIYWANEAYFGFGVGAARYVQGKRELNVRNTQDYIRRLFSGESPTFQSEELSDHERAFETAAIQLRRMEGIDRSGFRSQTGWDLPSLLGEPLQAMIDAELLIDSGDRIYLSRRGKCVADGVIAKLFEQAVPAEVNP